jgi:hypothetical protein
MVNVLCVKELSDTVNQLQTCSGLEYSVKTVHGVVAIRSRITERQETGETKVLFLIKD